MSNPAYTGKCNSCGHAESVHVNKLPIAAETYNRGCKHKPWSHCANYRPQVDIEAHNTASGQPPVVLYEFQKQYLRGLPSKYIFAADTGTGKSFMALAHYDAKAYLKPLLVIAPASKVNTGDWERDIKHYFAGRIVPEYEIYSYEKFSRVPSVAQYKKTGDRGKLRDWLTKHPGDFAIIADEVHKAKNPQSRMGKAVFEVSQSANTFIGLSATPAPNGWIDVANYFKMFNLTKNKTAFKTRYVNEQNFKGFPEIIGYYREDELQRNWNNMAKPLNKDQALDLPALVAVPVSLPPGSEYAKVMKARIFEDKFLDNPSALLHALRQSITEPKIKWLDEFLEGVSDNVVVFYNYKSERDKILAMIKKNHNKRLVIRQDGEKHEVPNKDNWATLKRTITLAQYQSGSTGIELTYAATTVYFSPTYSYSNYEQSIGRINRHGQTHKMTLYLLCAVATVEREIWAALRSKSDFQRTQWLSKQEWYNEDHERSLHD
ncbi:MAG: DEAD/DEAH box helicase family protein [Candidatus Saccharimonadales bacterium]